MLSSPKKILGGIAKDLSDTKWPDSGKPMFNVTMMSEPNQKEFKKLSPTLHAIKLDYDIKDFFDHDGVKPFGLRAHEIMLTNKFIDRKEDNEVTKMNNRFEIRYWLRCFNTF